MLTRVVNPNQLKPGQLAGAHKVKGTVRGPFMYVKQFSAIYATIKDNANPPNLWEKAYHDIIPYDHSRAVYTYKVADFTISTAEAQREESIWAKPSTKRSTRSEEISSEDEYHSKRRRS